MASIVEYILIAVMMVLCFFAHVRCKINHIKQGWLLYLCDFCFVIVMTMIVKREMVVGTYNLGLIWLIAIITVILAGLLLSDAIHLAKMINDSKQSR